MSVLRNMGRVLALLGMPQTCLYSLLNLPGLAFVAHGLRVYRQQSSDDECQGCGFFAMGNKSSLPTLLDFPGILCRNSKLGTDVTQITSLDFLDPCCSCHFKPCSLDSKECANCSQTYLYFVNHTLEALSLAQAWLQPNALFLLQEHHSVDSAIHSFCIFSCCKGTKL